MKKKILISNIFFLTCFISFLFLSTDTVNGAETEQSKDKYVAAKSGLNLRSEPNKLSKAVTLIPFGSKVTIEKSEGDEIFLDGRYGKWVNVKYGNNTGWVFSGFLSDFKPDTIIKIAADFYRDKYRKDEWSSEFKQLTHFKDSEVSIEGICDNYIVLKTPVPLQGSTDAGCFVWRYDVKQKKFFEVFNEKSESRIHHLYKIDLLYLDNDKYPDLVAYDGFDGTGWMYILLGSEKGFKSVFDWDSNCTDLYNVAIGSCGDMEFVCEKIISIGEKGTMNFFRFNCNHRKFEKYAEGELTISSGTITSIDLKNMSVIIKDEKDSKDMSYKLYKSYTSSAGTEYLKKNKFQKDDYVFFDYVILDGKKIIISIWKN